jgi:molybdopterin/thiamine biosynthesis adenylyltransferase/proteasome lid subunit RPN8/RPN11
LFYVLDAVLGAIDRSIAIHEPERGGALLGPEGRPVITSFVFDREARATRSTYQPSRALAEQVHSLEASTGLEFKGIVHSHPGGLDRPSHQDELELELGLLLNPHLSFYAAPIVSRGFGRRELGEHELALSVDSKISFFSATRVREGKIIVEQRSVKDVPLQQHLVALTRHFEVEEEAEVELISQQLSGADVLAGRIVFPGDLELLVLTSELYPDVPPLVLATQDGETKQLQVAWDLQTPADHRLIESVSSVLGGKPPFHFGYGPRPNLLLTEDAALAALARWPAGYSGHPPAVQAEAVRQGLFARSKGVLSEDLSEASVLLLGAGSVGSVMAEQLVRSGVGRLAVLDPEPVEAANVSRTVYEAGDIGMPKPTALARHLLQINPALRLETFDASVQDVDQAELASQIESATLVVAATDDPEAQLRVNRLAYQHATPALYVGLTAGAQGGEAIVVVPEATPCYLCATVIRHEAPGTEELSRDVDYGSGRLKGEIALGCDIHHVTTAATKLALSLLVAATESSLAEFAQEAVRREQTYLTLSMVPDYWMYPQIFDGVKGQYSHQSVWLTPPRRPACPICGEERAESGDGAQAAEPSLEAIRAAVPDSNGNETTEETHEQRPGRSEQTA